MKRVNALMERVAVNESDPTRRYFLKLIGIGVGTTLMGGVHVPLAFGEEIFPSKKITWVCPAKPGGGWDLIARLISPYLGEHLRDVSKGAKGGDVIIKNEDQAGGMRAYSNILNAKPDGYTIGDFNSGLAAESKVSKIDLDYQSYTFLLRTTLGLKVVVTRKDGFKSWDDMINAGAKKEIKWACASFARDVHIMTIFVKEAAKVPARLINFPGTAESVNAVLRGDVDIATLSEESAKTMIDSGEFRVLTALSKVSKYPGVPTIGQLGYPELADVCVTHRLLVGPPKLPNKVVEILIAGFKKVFSDADFLKQAAKADFEPLPLFGADADRQARKIFKFYDDNAAMLKRNLS